jgi:predicted HicB family RNase H-like nuclease
MAAKRRTAKKATKARRPAARKSTSKAKHTIRANRASESKSEHYMKYSGKFTVRLPRSLHQALVDRAEREGVSLNLFVTNALSRNVASGKK